MLQRISKTSLGSVPCFLVKTDFHCGVSIYFHVSENIFVNTIIKLYYSTVTPDGQWKCSWKCYRTKERVVHRIANGKSLTVPLFQNLPSLKLTSWPNLGIIRPKRPHADHKTLNFQFKYHNAPTGQYQFLIFFGLSHDFKTSAI